MSTLHKAKIHEFLQDITVAVFKMNYRVAFRPELPQQFCQIKYSRGAAGRVLLIDAAEAVTERYRGIVEGVRAKAENKRGNG